MTRIEELAGLIARYAATDGIHSTALPRVSLIRASNPTEPIHGVFEPSFCLMAQGRKQLMVGPRVYRYDPSRYLVVSVDLPVSGQVLEASPERPYLCFKLDLDPAMLIGMILEAGPPAEAERARAGVMVTAVTPELGDAVVRLLRLLATPRDIPALAPLAEKEILYRLLIGDQAGTMRQIALRDSKLRRVARAIGWIKKNYRAPFRIEAVARAAAMSPSALHAHFRTVTAMSPLQYQKQLRLQEARRLMLGRAMDASAAAYDVGYESPSQFSREYRRLFGEPPARDIARLREAPELV